MDNVLLPGISKLELEQNWELLFGIGGLELGYCTPTWHRGAGTGALYSYLASVGWNWDCVLLPSIGGLEMGLCIPTWHRWAGNGTVQCAFLPGIGGLELGHSNELFLSCVLVLVLRSVQQKVRFYVSLGL